jgi:hypothetical protein
VLGRQCSVWYWEAPRIIVGDDVNRKLVRKPLTEELVYPNILCIAMREQKREARAALR